MDKDIKILKGVESYNIAVGVEGRTDAYGKTPTEKGFIITGK